MILDGIETLDVHVAVPTLAPCHDRMWSRSFPTPIGSTDDVLDKIRVMFHEISQESGDYIDFIFDHELFDLEPKTGKHPMVSCCMLPYYKVPFILQSFKGQGMNVSELIHELGHGFAFYTAARKQKLYAYHRSIAAINETHSNTMELFSYPYTELFFGEQSDRFIRAHLTDKLLRMPHRCAIDEFEHTGLRRSGDDKGTEVRAVVRD